MKPKINNELRNNRFSNDYKLYVRSKMNKLFELKENASREWAVQTIGLNEELCNYTTQNIETLTTNEFEIITWELIFVCCWEDQ